MLYDNLKALKQNLLEQGRDEGLKEGINRGRDEEAKKRDDGIRNMLKAGIASASDIAKFFSLPEEHVLKLKSQLA